MNTIYLNNSATYPGFITFSNIPPPSLVGNKNQYPFSISISAVDAGEHYIDLYSFNSRSSPYQTPQNKWSHLVPQWRFTDLEGNVINSIKTTDILLSSGNTFIGVSGYAEFYYIDDLSTVDDTPVLLWATMQVSGVPNIDDTTIGKHTFPSFINSKVATVCPYFVNPLTPSKLSITRNGIDEMSTSFYWVSTNIGNVITIEGEYAGNDCGGNSVSSTIMYDYPSSNAHGFSMGEIEKRIITMPMSSQTWADIDTGSNIDYFQTYDDKGFRIGGYVRNTVYPYNTSLAATITAGVSATFVVPETENPFIWISHPNAGQIYKINYPNTPSTFVDYVTAFIPNLAAYQKVSYPTPIITEISDYNPLTGFGGIYSMAVDSCFNVWAADSEQDKLFKFSSSGQLLSTINFNGMLRNELTGALIGSSLTPITSSFSKSVTYGFSLGNDFEKYKNFIIKLDFSFNPEVLYYNSITLTKTTTPTIKLYENINTYFTTDSILYIPVTLEDISTSIGNTRLILTYTGVLQTSGIYTHGSGPDAREDISFDLFTSLLNPVPAGISLDRDEHVWVSFFNENTILKINKDTGTINNEYVISGPKYNSTEFTIRSTIVETDINDNIWTSVSHPLSSRLVKLTSTANQLLSVSLPLCAEPMDIVIDPDNNAWVTLTEQSGPPYLSGGVWCFDTNGTRVSAFSAVHPSYMTIDVDSNIWYISNLNKVTKINRSTGQSSEVTIGSAIETWYSSALSLEYNLLEGIACDTFNRIWVINSYENNVYLLSGGVVNDVINIYDAKTAWYNDNGQYSLSGEWEKSLQAFGDWSGIRRIMKYSPNSLNSQVCSVYLTGQSSEFSIDSFDNYYIRRPNESWDVTTQMRNYALPTHIYENPNLFLGYIDAMVGTLENGKVSLGRMSYEKIANFGRNVIDIDVSNIDQLYSLAESMDVYISDYRFSYPYDIKRLMDIGSVSHSKLWGTRCKCTMHFGTHRICEVCGHEHPLNRGSEIDTLTYLVTAGTPVLAMHRYIPNKFDILEPVVSNQTIGQSLSGKLLNSVAEYTFFNYDRTPCGVQVAGVINWEDEYTTLSESSSALEEWYGSGKLLEKMFNYHLYKGCGI